MVYGTLSKIKLAFELRCKIVVLTLLTCFLSGLGLALDLKNHRVPWPCWPLTHPSWFHLSGKLGKTQRVRESQK